MTSPKNQSIHQSWVIAWVRTPESLYFISLNFFSLVSITFVPLPKRLQFSLASTPETLLRALSQFSPTQICANLLAPTSRLGTTLRCRILDVVQCRDTPKAYRLPFAKRPTSNQCSWESLLSTRGVHLVQPQCRLAPSIVPDTICPSTFILGQTPPT